jgi:hypothetical protein
MNRICVNIHCFTVLQFSPTFPGKFHLLKGRENWLMRSTASLCFHVPLDRYSRNWYEGYAIGDPSNLVLDAYNNMTELWNYQVGAAQASLNFFFPLALKPQIGPWPTSMKLSVSFQFTRSWTLRRTWAGDLVVRPLPVHKHRKTYTHKHYTLGRRLATTKKKKNKSWLKCKSF